MKIRTKVRVLHARSGGMHQQVFEWETKKSGNIRDVVFYLMEKFSNPSDFPAGYTSRPIQAGDRLELTTLDGPLAGEVVLFEVLSPYQVQEI